MAKIMLVEDDKNLSSIYKDRLLAEGYEIVEAHDGEEALALAVKEKPVLIISDVMMPKISGFDMLDILRSTPETKNTKVIMMTALSQSEDQQRATQLGADKYLVKSQVTLDDVARVVKEVLESGGQAAVSSEPAPTEQPTAQSTAETVPTEQPTAQSAQEPVLQMAPAQEQVIAQPSSQPLETMAAPVEQNVNPAMTATEQAESIEQEKSELNAVINNASIPEPAAPSVEVTEAPSPTPEPTSGEKVVSVPTENAESKPDIMELYQQEMAKESSQAGSNQSNQPSDQPFDPHSISL